MNEELAGLISETGVATRPRWQDIIILQNFAPAPPPPICIEVSWWHRGFNFVVLDRGAPKHFGKCRAAGNPALERETSIRACLAEHRSGPLMVPPARSAASERIAVQMSPFVEGSHYGRIAPTQSAGDFLDTVRRVLEGAAELVDFGKTHHLDSAQSGARIGLVKSASECLDYFATNSLLAADLLDALATTLSAAGSVPARPQHGDLWWNNLILSGATTWLIDFEAYGVVQVPLYDELSLLGSTLGLRRGLRGGELAALSGDDAEARGCRCILAERARSEGVELSQLDGVLAFHAIRRAYTVHLHGGEDYAVPHLANLLDVAERLGEGDRGLLLDE